MKLTIILIGALLCVNSQCAESKSEYHALQKELIEIRNTNVKNPNLMRLIATSLEEMEANDVSLVHFDMLSEALINHFFDVNKGEPPKDLLSLHLISAIRELNKLATKSVKERKATQKELIKYRQAVKAVIDDPLLGEQFQVQTREMSLAAEIRLGFNCALAIFDTDNPWIVVNTGQIKLLKTMSPIVEHWGFSEQSEAMLVAAAIASGKFQLVAEVVK